MPCWNCGKSEGDSRHHFLFIGYGGDIHLRQCLVCKKTICQFCMSGGCPYCRHLRLQKIYERMRVYSCNYKGRIPLDNSKPQQSIALGDWFYDKIQSIRETQRNGGRQRFRLDLQSRVYQRHGGGINGEGRHVLSNHLVL